MIDVIDAPSTTTLLPPELFTAIPETHDELGDAITSLWNAHQASKKAIRATNEELRALRAQLGAQLAEMKLRLAKPGRGGQWSSFLKSRAIPRATADRLVVRYLQSLNPKENVLIDATSEPTKEEMAGIFNSILPKLRRYLKTPYSVYNFAAIFVDHFECGEIVDGGILVRKPEVPAI